MNNKFLDAFTTAEQLQSFLDWEKGLREDIAKEILLEYDGDDREVWLTDCLSKCADIARGNK